MTDFNDFTGDGQTFTRAPLASRPDMPDYGIATEADGLLPWQHVSVQMAKAHN